MTELGLSGLLDPHLGSFSARTFVVAPERRIVHSHDGFLFLPRYSFSSIPALDRVLVPAGENNAARQRVVAAWSGIQPGRPAEDAYRKVGLGESVYDASLRDLARTRKSFLAQAVADTLFYRADAAQFEGAVWPVREVVAQVTLILLAAGVVFAATHLKLLTGRCQ